MRVFISGGCKNGKSSTAERIAVRLAEKAEPLYYVATMRPVDSEDAARIERHRKSRAGMGFHTVEIAENIEGIKELCNIGGTFLLDSTTALLSNEMFPSGSDVNLNAHIKICAGLSPIINDIKNIVIVSDYIYSDAAAYGKYTELFREYLAYIDRQCAEACEVVAEVSCGCPLVYKGKDLINEILEAGK